MKQLYRKCIERDIIDIHNVMYSVYNGRKIGEINECTNQHACIKRAKRKACGVGEKAE